MEPNTMRWIDFWVGVPLCFVFTVLDRLRRAVLGRQPPVRPRRILFVQLAEMGTMVVAYPALKKCQELFPDATLHFLCFSQTRSSVEMLELLDPSNILTIESRSLAGLVRDTLMFPWTMRRRRIDTVINLETFVRYSTLLSYLTGARNRVGFHRFNQEGLYTGHLVTHPVLYNPHVHAAHTFLDLVYALTASADQVPRVKRPLASDRLAIPKLRVDPATRARVWSKLAAVNPALGPTSKLIVLNPNASKRFPMRRLPLDDYARLAARLLEDPEVFVVVTGIPDEQADAQFICSRVGSPRIVDLAGRTTMTELLHLFDLAQVLITNDSGPAHFAALTGVHVVVFFGPETPDRYGPLASSVEVVYANYSCSPCVGPYNQRLTPCNDNQCLKHIDVDAVAARIGRRLRATVSA